MSEVATSCGIIVSRCLLANSQVLTWPSYHISCRGKKQPVEASGTVAGADMWSRTPQVQVKHSKDSGTVTAVVVTITSCV